MKLRALGVLLILVCVTRTVAAQGPSVSKDTSSRALVGVWEGTFSSDHGMSGGFRLEVARDTAWAVTTNIVMDQPMQATGTRIHVEGNRLSWTQDTMGASCQATSALEGNVLKGKMDCGHAVASFELKKRPDR